MGQYERMIRRFETSNFEFQQRLAVIPIGTNRDPKNQNRYYHNLHVFMKNLASLQRERGRDTVGLDAALISANDLTRDIRETLAIYEKASWRKDIPFDVFCNYVLPYRLGFEPPDNWREYFIKSFFRTNDSLFFNKDIAHASWAVYEWLVRRKRDFLGRMGRNGYDLPYLPPDFLDQLPLGSCYQLAPVEVAAMRSAGIPAAIDFTPHYANENADHEWAAIVLDSTHCIPFQLPFARDGGGRSEPPSIWASYKEPNSILSKVYRITFSPDYDSHFFQRGYCSYLPDYFDDPFLKDVTALYTLTSDLVLPLTAQTTGDSRWCYLAVFSCPSWTPVAWGRVSNHWAAFKDIGRGGVYLPISLSRKSMRVLNYPFLLRADGEVHSFVPDTSHLIAVRLTRKYPLDGRNLKLYSRRMIGGVFQGASEPDFSDATDLYVIKTDPGDQFRTIYVHDKRAFKYLRYVAPNGSYGNVAEVEFYWDSFSPKSLSGRVIGTTGARNEDSRRVVGAAFDGDPRSFVDLANPDGNWMGLELYEKSRVKKIRYLARVQDWMPLTMINGVFQGADSPDFNDAVTLYTVKNNPGDYYNAAYPKVRRRFRYVRYLSPEGAHCNVAEIEFYSGVADRNPLIGKTIGTGGSRYGDPKTGRQSAFDGDPTTFFNAKQANSAWVGLRFSKKQQIRKIRFLPRNDLNDIYPGDLYELFFWNNKWVSLGRMRADTTFLVYKNVPSNAILWLRDLSAGVEERIFTYENGQQVWR